MSIKHVESALSFKNIYGWYQNMHIKKSHKRLTNIAINKKESIYANRERAYQYYSKRYELDYPKTEIKGQKISKYTNSIQDLNRKEYLFFSFVQ